MKFIHDASDFEALIAAVGADRNIALPLVEKDYWVTHTLWAFHQTRLDIWFKGGTALSKGFNLIERFSEDIDLCIKSGSALGLPAVTSWTSDNRGPIASRTAFYQALEGALQVPSATVKLQPASLGGKANGASYHITYPALFAADLPESMRPFVLAELGDARVTPVLVRELSSFVHDHLERAGQLHGLVDNRPKQVRCLHPLAVLIEKLDAIGKRYHRKPFLPASFIRHYEDAARIIQQLEQFDRLAKPTKDLIDEMVQLRQIAKRPSPTDDAFVLGDTAKKLALEQAHASIAPMFWGPRVKIDEACETIRNWLSSIELLP